MYFTYAFVYLPAYVCVCASVRKYNGAWLTLALTKQQTNLTDSVKIQHLKRTHVK